MTKTVQKFFLAANSGIGFVCRFADNYDPADGWRAFLIKGGPGTGKSSFMKHFAYHAHKKGKAVILCPCSSDPDSLDGVILPYEKIILLDATAPHTVEPKLPGVCENIVDLGQFWNSEILRKHTVEILTASRENSRLHAKAKQYLSAVGSVAKSRMALSGQCVDTARCTAYAERLCHRWLPCRKTASEHEWHRFSEGVTPRGVIGFTDSILPEYREKIIFCDPWSGAARIFMQTVRVCVRRAGYDPITVHNPILPDVIDHILIPELSLAFFTESRAGQLPTDERRIHARRFYDVATLHAHRERLNFDRRIAQDLTGEACRCLSQAKNMHDELEKYYIAAMDFPALTDFAENFTAKVLQ